MRKPMTISDNVIDDVENFKYLGLIVQKDGFGMDDKRIMYN
jgi:hypothetical protein